MAITNCPFDVTPLDQSSLTKTPKLGNLSYTHQDYESLKTRLIKFIREKFPRDFNDFIESSLAIMLVEIWAFIADTLSFKIDQIANEIYPNTVTELENMFRIVQTTGFKPTPPIAAIASVSATISAVQSVDMIIPAGVSVDISINNQLITYQVFPVDVNGNPLFNEDIIIQAGSLSNTSLVAIEGKTFNETTTANGLPSQIIPLEQFPALLDSINVSVDGVVWTEVEYFTDSQPRREYRVEYDSNYRAFIIFGNNITGLIPPNGSQISITYRRGGGTIGNVITGVIDFARQFDVQDLGYSIPVSFRNYTSATGGYNGDSIEDIRLKLPSYLKTQDRAVTGEDYKALADNFSTPYHGQIGKSTAVLRNHGCAGNIIDIYVLARDDFNNLIEVSDELRADLIEELDDKKMITDYVCVRDGAIIFVDVTLDITLDKSLRKNKEEIDVRVRRRVDQFFHLNNWDYGKTLRDTELVKELSDIREIDKFDATFVTNDEENSGDIVTAKFYEIIRPDSTTINYLFE